MDSLLVEYKFRAIVIRLFTAFHQNTDTVLIECIKIQIRDPYRLVCQQRQQYLVQKIRHSGFIGISLVQGKVRKIVKKSEEVQF